MKYLSPYRLHEVISTWLILATMGCGYTTNDKRCLENKHIRDTLRHRGYTYYAGHESECPVLLRAKWGKCKNLEYLIPPTCMGLQDIWFYDQFVAKGSRIAVGYYYGTGDSDVADAFLLSTDGGKSWRHVDIDRLAEVDEGIRKLVLTGSSGIELYLEASDGPSIFYSKDNGETWDTRP